MKRHLALLLPLALVACQDAFQTVAPAAPESLAPLLSAAPGAETIPGQYIVVFDDRVADAPGLARRLVATYGGDLRFSYQHALKGFAGQLPQQAVEALRRHPNVAFIEEDQVMRTVTTQSNATWGLDRIDQRNLPLSGSFTYTNTGAGVHAYIIDTGILLTHNEFTGRIGNGYDAVTSGGTANDCNGHGTHVAGTVGGTVYGVAKKVTLHPVRVLNCSGSGSTSGVIAGVDWVSGNRITPAVANMSLGGSASSSLDNAVNNSINRGVTYAIAAGNGNFLGIAQNACNYSPARVAAAITVSATNSSDTKASWANYGSCLDIFAPGVSITSAWYTGNTATNTISGTSMAAPHVAGVAALYLQSNTGATPSQVASALTGSATTGVVRSAGSKSPNRLLFTSY